MDGIARRRDDVRQIKLSRTDPEPRLVKLVIAVADDDPTLDDHSRPLQLSVLTWGEELEVGLIVDTSTSCPSSCVQCRHIIGTGSWHVSKLDQGVGSGGIGPKARLDLVRAEYAERRSRPPDGILWIVSRRSTADDGLRPSSSRARRSDVSTAGGIGHG
jgi:hypothetical protein